MPAEVDKCVTRILPELRKQYPNKSEQEIKQIAWGRCTNLYKEGKLKRDGKEVNLW